MSISYINYTEKNKVRKEIQLDLVNCEKIKYKNKNKFFGKNDRDFLCINFTSLKNQTLTNYFIFSKVGFNILEFTLKYDYNYLATLNESFKNYFLDSTDTITILFPQLYFNPNDDKNPLDVYSDYTSIDISKNRLYSMEYRYAETKLLENQDIILDDPDLKDSVIHLADKTEYVVTREDNINVPLVNIRFFLDGFYYNNYKRIYKKLPEILAQVFGIMEPLIIIFSILTEYFTKYNLDNVLVNNFLCYFTENQSKDDKIIWANQNFKDFKKIFKNVKSKENLESNNINNLSIQDENNENKKEINCNSDFLPKKTNFRQTYNFHERKKSENENDLFNEIHIELVENNNKYHKNVINTDNNNKVNYDPYSLKKISKLKKSNSEDKNIRLTNSRRF